MTDDKQSAKDLLAKVVNKVPQSINAASVEVVREWKKLNSKAQKALESSKASKETLLGLYTQLCQYK